MDTFYCEYHDRVEDPASAGYNLVPFELEGALIEIEVCDVGLVDMEHEANQELNR
jgi:hypothetical protein